MNVHKIYAMPSGDDLTMYAVLPSDGSRGFIIGTLSEAVQLRSALNRLIDNRDYSGEIASDDERLGHRWLTVADAGDLVRRTTGEEIPLRTIRYACDNGHINGAKKHGRDWKFSENKFLWWVNNRPKPGRK